MADYCLRTTQSTEAEASHGLGLEYHDIDDAVAAARIVGEALSRSRAIGLLVNNFSIFFTKPFVVYTAKNFNSLVPTTDPEGRRCNR